MPGRPGRVQGPARMVLRGRDLDFGARRDRVEDPAAAAMVMGVTPTAETSEEMGLRMEIMVEMVAGTTVAVGGYLSSLFRTRMAVETHNLLCSLRR